MVADGQPPPVESPASFTAHASACSPLPAQDQNSAVNYRDSASSRGNLDWTQIESVLLMWLDWNQRYENLTQLMYQHATNFHTLQQLADELDRLRLEALARTAELLKSLGKP